MALGLVLKKKKVEHVITYKDGDIEVKFFCNEISAGKAKRMFQKNYKVTDENTSGVDLGGLNDDKLDNIIKRWEGVEDENGRPIPCMKANKILFYEAYPEIIEDFLYPEFEKLIDDTQKETEKEIKN